MAGPWTNDVGPFGVGPAHPDRREPPIPTLLTAEQLAALRDGLANCISILNAMSADLKAERDAPTGALYRSVPTSHDTPVSATHTAQLLHEQATGSSMTRQTGSNIPRQMGSAGNSAVRGCQATVTFDQGPVRRFSSKS